MPKQQSSPFVDDKIHWIDPKELISGKHELNWRKHPKEQVDALREAYNAIGFIDPITWGVTSKKILDGHGRLEAAIKSKLKAVPVIKVKLTEDQELLHLQNADNLQALARPDAAILRKLIERNQQAVAALPKKNSDALKALQSKLNDHATVLSVRTTDRQTDTIFDITARRAERREQLKEQADDSAAEADTVGQTVYRDDVVFEGDDDWGIPILSTNPKLLCIDPPKQTYDRTPESIKPNSWVCYTTRTGYLRDQQKAGGTLGFFCEDYKFAHLFDRIPEYALKFKEEGWTNVCEPDYSVWDTAPNGNTYPFAASLWNLYRSRYVLRYFQEIGLRILPILRWTSDDKLFDAAISTLPVGLPWLAMQVRTQAATLPPKEIRRMEAGFSDAIKITDPQGLIVYGEQNLESWIKGIIPKGCKLVMLKPFMTSLQERKREEAKLGKANMPKRKSG